MTDSKEEALIFAESNRDHFIDDLIELTQIPSISTDSNFKDDIIRAAKWMEKKFITMGMDEVKIIQTNGHPVVYAENLNAGKSVPTVLIYGHYDVQPPDPLEKWETEPFTPTIRDENLYGRGVSDMKGQVIACISAVEALNKHGGLPVNVKFIIEGEEEIGSPSLPQYIEKNKKLLNCDFALNLDGGMLGPDFPTIQYSLRGMAYFEIIVQGPSYDLHSGVYGGSVVNPANELARLIGGMHDEDGRITFPGFYKRVVDLDNEDRRNLAQIPIDDSLLIDLTGVPALYGEKGFSSVERIGGRPALDVHGILSGYTGEGSKSIIPSEAMAKISIRLVPDQDPDEVHKQVLQYFIDNANPGITFHVNEVGGTPASIIPMNSPYVKALAKAFETVWKKTPLYDRAGGSVPVVHQLEAILGVNTVMSGFGLPDDNLHAPNEKLSLGTWYKGINALIHFFYNLAD